MTNIAIRKDNGNKPASLATAEQRWEPFRLMRDLMGWDPFREMAPFAPQIPTGFAPSFEIKERKQCPRFKPP